MSPRYRQIWERTHSLPAACTFCDAVVQRWGRRADDGVIHHSDGDHDNDDPANLALAHRRCHTKYHSTGTTRSAETRRKQSEAARRRYSDPAERERTAAALRGNTNGLGRRDSDEVKARRAAHHIGVKRSAEARERIRAGRWGN